MQPDMDFDRQPFIVIWETTQACDLACRHCHLEAGPGRTELMSDAGQVDDGAGDAPGDPAARQPEDADGSEDAQGEAPGWSGAVQHGAGCYMVVVEVAFRTADSGRRHLPRSRRR